MVIEKIKQIPLHGILLKYHETGVLLTGKSGIGKSDIMLQLLQWGAQLVCDDAPSFSIQSDQGKKKLVGCCDDSFSGLLHIRDLGVLDIKLLFGQQVITKSVPLQLIIHLSEMHDNEHYKTPILSPEYEQVQHQQQTIQRLILPYNANRPMALLIKTAIKQFSLLQ
jgi:HPr kinase/phosphorylase